MTNACGGATIAGGSKNFMCGLCYACSGYNVILGGNCNINIIQTSRAGIAGILGGTYNQIQNSYCSFVLGTGITTDADYTAFVNKLSIKNITTSSAGLPAGSIWSDAGQLCVV
jgi:hypothetical protein